ncbi:MAG: glycosyl hydrolase family 8, partial [Proteobacteria bacterium]|nr:glycosyl hydrolase family 8 [Pseudomonadota bacterium]
MSIFYIITLSCLATQLSASEIQGPQADSEDRLSAMWSFYKYNYIKHGQVFSLDEKGVTTSEGQSYALLRAVWEKDKDAFDAILHWTLDHLKHDNDYLFAWKYSRGAVADRNSASDADVDIAFALILASRNFKEKSYLRTAQLIVKDIWRREVLKTKSGHYYLLPGIWANSGGLAEIRLGYFAPAAYQLFAELDPDHHWLNLASDGYDLLRRGFNEIHWVLPPIAVAVDLKTGKITPVKPDSHRQSKASFGYDVFPLYWRIALDVSWNARRVDDIAEKLLKPLTLELEANGRLVDQYATDGRKESNYEAPTLYATAYSLAKVFDPSLAARLRVAKISSIFSSYQDTDATSYYLQNWAWFSLAFDLKATRSFNELFPYLRPFSQATFLQTFPLFLVLVVLLFWMIGAWLPWARYVTLTVCLMLCVRYLVWRLGTFNLVHILPASFSILLYIAEIYSFGSVALLLIQTLPFSLKETIKKSDVSLQPDEFPAVAVMIPIFNEPLDILESTLIACNNLDYPHKKIYVLDDGRKMETKQLTLDFGGIYIEGPKKHAKAGNLNHALSKSSEDFVAIFDTDHMPLKHFL